MVCVLNYILRLLYYATIADTLKGSLCDFVAFCFVLLFVLYPNLTLIPFTFISVSRGFVFVYMCMCSALLV